MLLHPNNINQNGSDDPAVSRYCRQVSIESPGLELSSNFVFNCEVPVPDVPPKGARIKVVCAGACYRNRNRLPSNSSTQATIPEELPSQTNYGIRDSALFPGFEVSGVIDELGNDVTPGNGLVIGQRVVLYPHDAIPHGYSEFVVVSDLSYVIPVPDNLPLSIAAMLPTGALMGKNAVLAAHAYVLELLRERPDNKEVKILIVGTGGLALWAIRIAAHHFGNSEHRDRVKVTVACMRDEGFKVAQSVHKNVNLVQWSEDLYETQIIERTTNACNGLVDIVIDFGTTARTLQRSLQCLNKKGVVLVNEEVAERLLPKFLPLAEKQEQKIQPVAKGNVEQLTELVQLVSSGEIIPPPHTVFPADQACSVVQKLSKSEIPGRAILRFHDIQ